MKDREEILARVRILVNAELERRLALAFERLPRSCHYNHRQPLDNRTNADGDRNPTYNTVSHLHGQTIGLCMYGATKVNDTWKVADSEHEAWLGNICEDPIDAQRCPYFTPGKSKEEVLALFRQDLANSEWLNSNMPELAALVWVLDSKGSPRIGWWQRLLVYFRRTRPAPLLVLPDLPDEILNS